MKFCPPARLVFLAAAIAALPAAAQTNQYPFQNPGLPVEERVNNIVSLMTLEEKAAFLSSRPGVPRMGIRAMGHVEGLHGLARGGPSSRAKPGRSKCLCPPAPWLIGTQAAIHLLWSRENSIFPSAPPPPIFVCRKPSTCITEPSKPHDS